VHRLIAALTCWCVISIGVLGSAEVRAQAVPGCGNLQNAFGPYDYRDPVARGEPLNLVERAHFTLDVEALRRGTTGPVIGDLDYTLRAFPNHHRALNSVANYGLHGGRWTNPEVRSVECYFKRAMTFRADDEIVRMLYANYLAKAGRWQEAEEQYQAALELTPDAPELNYNVGLFYVNRGQIEKAAKHAKIAYDAGYPLQGLRKKLEASQKAR
jgi:tetratricopeptide (TPR) repeat protein